MNLVFFFILEIIKNKYLKIIFSGLYCIVLYCFVLYCIVLYCIVLFCIVLYCIVLYCIVLHCIVLYCFVFYFIVLYCIVLSYIVLYCINTNKKIQKIHLIFSVFYEKVNLFSFFHIIFPFNSFSNFCFFTKLKFFIFPHYQKHCKV